jgi:hypothetical protein
MIIILIQRLLQEKIINIDIMLEKVILNSMKE